MRLTKLIAIVMIGFTCSVQADQSEIEYLLNAVADSNCEYFRNGKKHSAEKAAKHLRMKYDRAKKYVTSAEDFIAKLASRSSISKKPYRYTCPDGSNGYTATWFRKKLSDYRARVALQSP